jgi:hypothetical protein
MTTQSIIEGLTILEKYRTKPNGYNTGAEHDQIYAYSTDLPASEEDVNRLVKLGWFQEDSGREGSTFANYNPKEGWSCYV